MQSLCLRLSVAVVLIVAVVLVVRGSALPGEATTPALAGESAAKIVIDYPLDGSVFPPEITAPTFLWRDSAEEVKHWEVEVSFADRSVGLHAETAGEYMRMGEIDTQAGTGDQLVPLTPEQQKTHTWKPDAETWAAIKKHSVRSPATITIVGLAEGNAPVAASHGSVKIWTSVDPVGAPIFYRDVPLMLTPPGEKGAIQPLPPSALPLIKWRLRDIAEPESRVVMQNLPTCANCHSFSSDGKTLGLDLDGPRNDKALYALVPISKNTVIDNQNVVRWSSFRENQDASGPEPAVKRFGFMSQVSPDGRYVVTSVAPPTTGNTHQSEVPGFAPGLLDRLFSTNYRNIWFTQVFYPTRGILVWYDRERSTLRPLPGADDPQFVQTSAFWSPDGRYLIFSRAKASDPYPPGASRPEYANDPREPQVQYDLYRIPFNEGRGGRAEPIAGASENGMSNDFPKVSPDGRWIIFVQNKTGLLMRPDSKLYIIPFEGGKARRMNCNTSLMNSWHSFSPNGRWLAFSSKARSPYTQLMLTHIDAHGNDTPAILVENTTAGNHAVNIPEFLNIAPGSLEKIDPKATEFYRLFSLGYDLMKSNRFAEAIPIWREAVQRDPQDALAHYAYATALSANNQERDAVEEYRKACALDGRYASWFSHLAVSLALTGDLRGAVENWRKSLALDPSNTQTETDLGAALFETGQRQEGIEHLRKAVEAAPDFADGRSHLGWALAQMGRADTAVEQLQKAVELAPATVEYRFNLGFVLEQTRDFPGAISNFQKTVELTRGEDWRCLSALAEAYDKAGDSSHAVEFGQQALDVGMRQHDAQLEKNLREALERYQANRQTSPVN